MNNSGNQIRNKMISQYPKTDVAKIAGLERFIHRKFPDCTTMVEPYLLFTKGEDEYVGFRNELSYLEVRKYKVQHPDLLLFLSVGMIILELDGPIHDKKTKKTMDRNDIYSVNNLKFRVVNESNLKYDLGVAKTSPLSQDQINEAFYKQLTSSVVGKCVRSPVYHANERYDGKQY